jgi:succinate dehydrogenase / fumarate reductase, cytochrome b subunit
LKEAILSSVLKALSSSVGKKFVMGVTGLLLCGFLVTHLAGNLLLYAGADAYNKYAHTLHSQRILLLVAEVILYGLFIAHIYLAFHTTAENRVARGHRYAVKRSKLDAAPHTTSWPVRPEAWMFISGAIVLFFLIVHVGQFAWEIWLPGPKGEEPFPKAIRILNDNFTAFVYLIGVGILGIHLWHGFASAFQSLGITHPRYAGLIKWAGVVFATVIGIGFASFVVFARMATNSGH